MGNMLINIIGIAIFSILAIFSGFILSDYWHEKQSEANVAAILNDAEILSGALDTVSIDNKTLNLPTTCDPDPTSEDKEGCLDPLIAEKYIDQVPFNKDGKKWILNDEDGDSQPDSLVFSGLSERECQIANNKVFPDLFTLDDPVPDCTSSPSNVICCSN